MSQQRTRVAYLLIRQWGYRAGEVAAALNWGPVTMSMMLTRVATRLSQEPTTQRELDRLGRKSRCKGLTPVPLLVQHTF